MQSLKDTNFDVSKIINGDDLRSKGRPPKLISLEHAADLVMVLPGVQAQKFRGKYAEIIKAYLKGDHSMLGNDHEMTGDQPPVAQEGGAAALPAEKKQGGRVKKVARFVPTSIFGAAGMPAYTSGSMPGAAPAVATYTSGSMPGAAPVPATYSGGPRRASPATAVGASAVPVQVARDAGGLDMPIVQAMPMDVDKYATMMLTTISSTQASYNKATADLVAAKDMVIAAKEEVIKAKDHSLAQVTKAKDDALAQVTKAKDDAMKAKDEMIDMLKRRLESTEEDLAVANRGVL